MTVAEFIDWYYGVAEYLDARKAMIGVTGVSAHFAGEEVEMPGPHIALVMDFPEQQTADFTLNDTLPTDIEVAMIVYAGEKATTKEAATEALTILQSAATLLRRAYLGTLNKSDTPVAFVNVSPDMFTVGAIYNVKFKII